MKGLLIKTSGELLEVRSNGERFSLDELQGFVGGYIESYPSFACKEYMKDFLLYVNEEGTMLNLKRNKYAEKLLSKKMYCIYGDCLLVKEENKTFDTKSLDSEDIKFFKRCIEGE